MDIPAFDIVMPAAIVVICASIIFVTWRLTRPAVSAMAIPTPAAVTPPVARVATNELHQWHARHGRTVQVWIEHHEAVLQKVSAEGLRVDLMGEDLTAGHDAMADAMRDAITSHPAPPMRAQLSALVVSSEATLHALRRSEYQDAERQHLTYLQYRDSWLQRLRQFSSGDSNIRQLRTIPRQTPPTENIWLSGEH